MKAPYFSTSFSESGKKAKKRFDNIFSSGRRRGVSLLALIALSAAASASLVACGGARSIGIIGGADGPTALFVTKHGDKPLYEELYAARIKYIGNASGVGKLMGLMEPDQFGEPNGMELETTNRPYGVIRRFSSDNPGLDSEAKRQAAIMLCLIENADFVRYQFPGRSLEFTREQLDAELGTLADYAESQEKFTEFFNRISGVDEAMNAEKALSAAIIDYNSSSYSDGECRAEGHSVFSVSGSVENGRVVYALTTYGEYGFEDGKFLKTAGTGVIPARITFDENDNVVEYKTPDDGSYYVPSVKEIFPEDYHSLILKSADQFYDELFAQEAVYAQAYLDEIGRKAEIVRHISRKSLTDNGVSNDVFNRIFTEKEKLWQYPYWIGSQERIEDGVRYVYTTGLKGMDKGGRKMIIMEKTRYDTGDLVEQLRFDAETGDEL